MACPSSVTDVHGSRKARQRAFVVQERRKQVGGQGMTVPQNAAHGLCPPGVSRCQKRLVDRLRPVRKLSADHRQQGLSLIRIIRQCGQNALCRLKHQFIVLRLNGRFSSHEIIGVGRSLHDVQQPFVHLRLDRNADGVDVFGTNGISLGASRSILFNCATRKSA